jgi:uncharacterized repeat protein (TIGR01451 family)
MNSWTRLFGHADASRTGGLRRAAVLLGLTCALMLAFAANAFGDAADPVLPIPNANPPIASPVHSIVTVNKANNTFTVQVWGGRWNGDPQSQLTPNAAPYAGTAPGQVIEIGWQWTTHNSDCNTGRAGVGVALDWDDASGTTLGAFSMGVASGSAAAALGNPVDNLIHPTPPLQALLGATAPQNGTPSAVILNPTTAQFNDTAALDAQNHPLWRSGCGINGQHTNVALPDGTTKTNNWNTGVWGPFTHIYSLARTTPISICPLMYDEHGTQATFGAQNGTTPTSSLIAAGNNHNGDNSLESNNTTPAGNGCFSTTIPRIVTSASNPPSGTHQIVGGSITDTATVSGNKPTGKVFFKVYKRASGQLTASCDPNTLVAGANNSLFATITNLTNSNSVDATSPAVTGLGPGTYDWVASYEGDGNNQPASGTCGDNNETSQIDKATPSLKTTASNNTVATAATIGAKLHDSVTVSGGFNPAAGAASVTFRLYRPGANCASATPFYSTTVPLNGQTTVGSGDSPATDQVGDWYWTVSYAGNTTDNDVAESCPNTDPDEVSKVKKDTPSLKTTASNNATAATIGAVLSDSVTVSGGFNPAASPATVTFRLYKPGADCTTATPFYTKTVSLNGSATVGSGNSPATNQVGNWYWTISYVGNATDNDVAESCPNTDPDEVSKVKSDTPSLKTTASNNTVATAATIGAKLHDSVTVSGGFNPAASPAAVTFRLYKPGADCTTATPFYTNTVSLNGSATVGSGDSPATNQVGDWYWTVSYAGNTTDNDVAESCPNTDPDEISKVKKDTPSLKTTASNNTNATAATLGAKLHDSVTVSGGFNPAASPASVTFRLYRPGANCTTATPFYTNTVPLNGSTTVGSGDSPATDQTGNWYWTVSYAGNTTDNDVAESCPNTDSDEVSQVVDLSITKTADKSSVETGQQVGFNITVTGSGPAKSVTLNDPLPGGPAANQLNWSLDTVTGALGKADCGISGAAGSQVLTCNAVDLGSAGTSGHYTVHIISATSASGPGFHFTNEATASAANHADVKAHDSIEVIALAIEKHADDNSVEVGSQVGYTITVTGSGPAKGVQLNDPLPGGPAANQLNWSLDTVTGALTKADCQITGGLGSQILSCNAVDLGHGTDGSTPDSYVVHVISQTDANGSGFHVTNTATATATNHSPVKDDDSTGGQPDNRIEVVALSITKTADKSPVDTGDPIGFVVTVTGSGPAKSVTLHDPLPAGPAGNTLDWSISGAVTGNAATKPSCQVTGVVGAETLDCTAVNLGAGADGSTPESYAVHVVSATTAGGPGFTRTNTATASASNHGDVDASATVKVVNPNVLVVKDGTPGTVHEGDTITFTYKVTNPGTDPIEIDSITDDKCSPIVGPTSKTGGNQDNLLDPGEVWTYTCQAVAKASDETKDANGNSVIVNTVVVKGHNDDTGKPVTSTDDHTTQVIHPAIAIDKTGPATATAGDKVSYVLTVTNPGDTPLGDPSVKVSDQQCNGDPVTLTSKNGDTSPGTLDPGDVWTYSCSVQTGANDSAIHNVATVTGCDKIGGCVNAQDSADTTLGAQLVLPERVTPGSAQLTGPTGCVAKAFNARVRGSKIATVVFVLDGKVVKRVTNKKNASLIQFRIDPKKMKIGVHRLVVNVTFAAGSGTKPKSIRLSFQRCAKKLQPPRFTG